MTDDGALLDEALDTFRPRFRSLEDDAANLAAHAQKVAAKRGAEAGGLGLVALQRHRGPAFRRLVQCYLAEGRRDLVEAHFKIDEWGSGLPDRAMRAWFHHFAAMGEGPCAVRCWQHYIRKNATMFWQDVRDRDAAAKRAKNDPGREPEYAFHQETLHKTKRLTLEAIALAARHFEAFGSPREQDWLERTRSEILAEVRTRHAAKPLPDEMDEAVFWALLQSGGETAGERLDTLPDRLAAYGAPAIKAFGQITVDRLAAAYREDVWALAYLLMDGCSDDAFDDFRNWLLLQGRDIYLGVLADPDAFDPAGLREKPLAEGLMDAVEQAHVMRTGKDLPRLRSPKVKRVEPREESFPAMLPKVAERMR